MSTAASPSAATPDVSRPIDRRWYAGFALSAMVHLLVLFSLGGFHSGGTREASESQLKSEWSVDHDLTEAPVVIPIVAQSQQADTRTSTDSLAGSTARQLQLQAEVDQTVLAPQTSALLSEWALEPYADETLNTPIGPLLNGTDPIGFAGSGSGTGTGEGTAFFGVPTDGRSFVFVVDSSNSMNHPHPGVAKTRFRKLKLELIKAIQNMKPEMTFHIIFFNDKTVPMPAGSPQPATPETTQRYFEWLVQVPALGNTDPRIALRSAVAMRPDVIYFLTDGQFESWVASDLKRIKQESTAIHTLMFGSRDGEEVMKKLAASNGGQYYYIP